MATGNINNAALSTYSTLSPSIVSQKWSEAMQQGVLDLEWLTMFQGKEGSNASIIEKEDLLKGDGDTINFTVGAELRGDGVTGSTQLITKEEKAKLNTYSTVIDFIRHATAGDRRFKSMSIAGRKLEYTKMLSKWMAMRKQNDGLLKFIKTGAFTSSGRANNTIYGGGVSSDLALTVNDQLHTGFFSDARKKLIALGAKPANISREKDYQTRYFNLLATTDMLSNLNNDGAWNNAQLMARPRENGKDADNPLFTGCFSGKTYGGIIPFEYMMPDHDNPENGAIGSPLQPRALLRDATTNFTSDTTLSMGGSAATSSTILYTKWFPGYDYLFTSGQTAAPDTTVYYAKIIDMPGATNAGKYEIVSYVGSANDGNMLTVTRNVGGTNPNGVHDANALVVPCNANGVAYGFVVVMGAMAMLRAYGNNGDGKSGRENLEYENQDYNFIKGAAIEAVFGQSPPVRADGKYANFIVGKVALAD